MSISNDRKKELKEQYKNTPSRMGVFLLQCNRNDMCMVIAAMDLNGAMNSIRFKLERGLHGNKAMQADWRKFGEAAFELKVLAELEFEDVNAMTEEEIQEELMELKDEWMDILADEDKNFYDVT